MDRIKVGDICYYHGSFCVATRVRHVKGITTISLMYQDGGSGSAIIHPHTPYEYEVFSTGYTIKGRGIRHILRQIRRAANKEYPQFDDIMKYHEGHNDESK